MLYLPDMPYKYPHENPEGYQHPGQMGLSYENVTMTAKDGVDIRGWFMYSNEGQSKYHEHERPTIVFMHENAGNIGLRIPYYKYVIENLGVNILVSNAELSKPHIDVALQP